MMPCIDQRALMRPLGLLYELCDWLTTDHVCVIDSVSHTDRLHNDSWQPPTRRQACDWHCYIPLRGWIITGTHINDTLTMRWVDVPCGCTLFVAALCATRQPLHRFTAATHQPALCR